MAAKRKFLVMAVVGAAAIAGLAGCSTGGEYEAPSGTGKIEKNEAVEAAATKASDDPFGGLSADQIADKAVAATKSARSIRIAGKVTSGAELLTVDFAVDSKGSCTGKIGMRGGNAELRKVGKVLYIKGDDTFWKASVGAQAHGITDLLKGRWMKVPQGSSSAMEGVCDLKAMLADTNKDALERQGMTRGPDAAVGGKPVVTLVKKKPGGETLTMYVAKEGAPYLLRVVKKGGTEPGTLTFSDFNKPVKAVAPPPDQVVDLGSLGSSVAGGALSRTGAGA
ncbi:hypothetical protein FBY35_2444 [Streptomyces sp. SLBN-118]|uniref:hypothetical protein n=1 Tax=Streptomyces sp. SLBN-118 TaxID=2768454 RepID=UPI00114E47C5|nr:hypothetical protein [Streptomyces sp. SLBN-118]TQK52019.1 hypothetical protein FBY35_2444 [Streptomyces sp. SLBN-118]